MKFRAVFKKNHRNRTNGSRDIAPQSGKIIEISRFFSKKKFIFTVKLTFSLEMKKKACVVYDSKTENHIHFFL